MRLGRQALLTRYLRAMVALALVLSSAMASYGHAACPHAKSRAQVDGAPILGAEARAEPREVAKHQHVPDESGKAHSSCMDGICHGWHAVLAKSASVAARVDVVPDAVIAIVRGDPRIASLERPPRTAVLA
jgi:hypothetical protein